MNDRVYEILDGFRVRAWKAWRMAQILEEGLDIPGKMGYRWHLYTMEQAEDLFFNGLEFWGVTEQEVYDYAARKKKG